MQMAAIYTRVSSNQQREAHTIASQTAALVEWATTLELEVPQQWIFEDEGYSGATLERPGLEQVRDLAAAGDIQVVLVHSPDRLSRKYAYQVLLTEEFGRHGVETRFLNGPSTATAEDQLLVQFQGMIAEYERAQILERSRRGKRHRARAGEISVLGGAPYGYRYIRKRDDNPAAYVVIEAEARVVRDVYEHYTGSGWSIAAITRWLNEQGVPTRKVGTRWERSTVWAMLRNPAYRGTACFGKTRRARRQRVTRPLRLRGGAASRDSANHERPREEWIEIPVPAIVDESTFARAQELLHENKVHARRRTVEPSLVQGLVSCQKCGYALSRASGRSSARRIHYYRCIGSDGWRHLGGPRCDTRPVRQDLLDEVVWTEVIRLLEEPALIQQELDRRLAAAQAADPTKKRTQAVERDLTRVGKSMERLLTAYQEDLLSLEQLRERMPLLRQREQTLRDELNALVEQTRERAAHLRLAETLSAFLTRLRAAAETLDIVERQRIVRLIVKEVLVNDDTIVIRHCIPVPSGPPPTNDGGPNNDTDNAVDSRSYLLRSGSTLAVAVEPDAGCPGQGAGDARPPFRPLRRRLQHLRAVPAGGRAGHGGRHTVPRPAAEADGERSQERGGPPVGAGFPGLQLHGRTDASAGRLAEGARPVQDAGSGTDAPHEARPLHPSRGGAVPLPRWVAGLFWTLRGSLCPAPPRPVDTAAASRRRLDALEACAHSLCGAAPSRRRQEAGGSDR